MSGGCWSKRRASLVSCVWPSYIVRLSRGMPTSEASWSDSQVVPIYNDVEGEQVPDHFVLNSSSLLQELHPSFHRNIRGYRWGWRHHRLPASCEAQSDLSAPDCLLTPSHSAAAT